MQPQWKQATGRPVPEISDLGSTFAIYFLGRVKYTLFAVFYKTCPRPFTPRPGVSPILVFIFSYSSIYILGHYINFVP